MTRICARTFSLTVQSMVTLLRTAQQELLGNDCEEFRHQEP